jgi:peptide/nickel transport system ATP-binding protein
VTELLKVTGLKKHFSVGRKLLKAVDGISITINKGETLGLIGESGSGKSTLGRAILRLIEPEFGEVIFEGENLRKLRAEKLRIKRRDMQIIFQDPLASLNPRMNIGETVEDPLIIHNIGKNTERKEKVKEYLDIVGIGRKFINSFPYEFSGGQQQRVGIARALILNPKFIVCDEPVSALDVSIQAQIISLLSELREKFSLSYLFIAHDLAVVKYISDRIAVMYLGRIMEIGSKDEIFRKPLHPYTKALISSFPKIPKDGIPQKIYETLKGEIPSPIDLSFGCRFRSRCPMAKEICQTSEEPKLKKVSSDHQVACLLV